MLLLAENFIGQGYFRMNFSSMFFSTGMNLKQKDDLSTVHAMVWSNGRMKKWKKKITVWLLVLKQ